MWDAQYLVRHEEGRPGSRACSLAEAPPLPRESRVWLTPEAGWNALGDAPASQEATGHGRASPEQVYGSFLVPVVGKGDS